MKILIACEFSGTVRDAFAIYGHDVMSCDLLETDKPGAHYKGDVMDIINDGWDMKRIDKNLGARNNDYMKKTIKDFPAYRISDKGVIETKWQWGPYYVGMNKKETWRVMPLKYDTKGYAVVTLCDINKRKRTRIHRIVAETFISDPPFAGAIVRHIDGNPRNNSVDNLAWGTYKQNEDDKILHGTWNTRNGGAKITKEQVFEIREKLNNGYKENDLAVEYNVSRPTITRIKNNKIWKNI